LGADPVTSRAKRKERRRERPLVGRFDLTGFGFSLGIEPAIGSELTIAGAGEKSGTYRVDAIEDHAIRVSKVSDSTVAGPECDTTIHVTPKREGVSVDEVRTVIGDGTFEVGGRVTATFVAPECMILGNEFSSAIVDDPKAERGRPNKPTALGQMLGNELARLREANEAELRKVFPTLPEPCKSCAFRRGTVPNGCEETVMDALKCVLEGKRFECHEVPGGATDEGAKRPLCQGWFNSLSLDRKAIEAPWPFTNDRAAWDRMASPRPVELDDDVRAALAAMGPAK
jgi:hypothetical protein